MQNDQENDIDGIRFIWNTTPRSKVQQARSIIHPAFHYSPLSCNVQQISYIPLTCSCEAVMNKFCPIDFNQKTIQCCICNNSMHLPPDYAKIISPKKLPFELFQNLSSFQYKSAKNTPPQNQNPNQKTFLPASSAHCLLFVIDLCLSDKEIEAIKSSLIQVLENVPTDGSVYIGLITFFRHVSVYELASKINTNFCINGTREYNLMDFMNILGIDLKQDPQGKSYEIFRRFIIPITSKSQLNKVIRRVRDVKKDQSITVNQRSARATGQAINVAISMAEVAPISPRLVFMLGGPCTVGPGTVIGLSLKEMMRSARELLSGENTKYFASAKKYYDSFCKKIIQKKIIMDLFAFTLEQPGLAEMSELFMSSGGMIVMHEEFADRIFKESFQKLYFPSSPEVPQVSLQTQAVISVYASKDVVINGAFGHCYALNKPKPFVSDKVIGKGKTHSWYLGSLDPEKTITILYETKQAQTKQNSFFIQLKTTYKNSQGVNITRVTTVQRQWSNQINDIAAGFDADAAIIYLARYCVHKALMEEQTNLRQYLDNSLIKWASYFAQFVKSDTSSFSLPENMRTFPQLIYHLRRSNFVNRFGSSLDESFYRAYTLNRESLTNCSTMIQPVLLKYTVDSLQPQAVPLDEQEMHDEVILLLDSYFNVIQWYGENAHQWLAQRYHESEQYAYIKDLFDAPKEDINYIMSTRFPVPNYYLTHPGHSKERYLKSRVNPKKEGGNMNENTITDDSDLKTFNQHLVNVVVNQNIN